MGRYLEVHEGHRGKIVGASQTSCACGFGYWILGRGSVKPSEKIRQLLQGACWRLLGGFAGHAVEGLGFSGPAWLIV